MKLSDELIFWKQQGPDKWGMDKFIKKAQELEKLAEAISNGNFNQAAVIEEARRLIS